MEWGQGHTPIKDVLLLLKKKKYLNFNGVPIPVLIEYEYQGKSDPVTEVTKCLSVHEEHSDARLGI